MAAGDPYTTVHAEGTCPTCGTELKIKTKIFNAAKMTALAVYSGIPGGETDDDAEMLRRVAQWLDRIDDATQSSALQGNVQPFAEHIVGREIQERLRRVAARLDGESLSHA